MPSPATHGRKPHCNVTSLPGSKSGPSPRRGDGRSLQKGETAEDTQWVWGWNCTNNPYRGALLGLAAGSRVSGRWVQSRRPLGPRGPRPSLILTPARRTALVLRTDAANARATVHTCPRVCVRACAVCWAKNPHGVWDTAPVQYVSLTKNPQVRARSGGSFKLRRFPSNLVTN